MPPSATSHRSAPASPHPRIHIDPELPCYQEGNWPDYGYDPEKAREELAASAYGGPEDLPKIRVMPGPVAGGYVRTAEAVLEQWRENLGIENAEMRTGWLDAWGQERDQVQVGRMSMGAVLPDPVSLLQGWVKRWAAYGMYQDDELAKLPDELQLIPRDSPAFCPKVREAEARLLGLYPFLPLTWGKMEWAVKPWVKHFESNIDTNFSTLLDMWIAEH